MKEDIILTEAPQSTAFSFELSVEGVVLELIEEDGVVLIKDQETLEEDWLYPAAVYGGFRHTGGV